MIKQTDLNQKCEHIRRLAGERYQEFLDAGYREHYSETGWLNDTPYLLQKAIYDDNHERLFFIDAFVYDFRDIRNYPGEPFGFELEAHFNSMSDNQPTFSVTLHADKMSVEQIETFFLGVYEKMECERYGD